MTEPRLVLNANADGVDVLHRNPREECNTDDADDAKQVDPRTAAAMLATGQARACEHCITSEAT